MINLKLHRTVGKTYVISVLISGACGIYLACYATGGIVCTLGFTFLGIIWLATTVLSFNAIRNGEIGKA